MLCRILIKALLAACCVSLEKYDGNAPLFYSPNHSRVCRSIQLRTRVLSCPPVRSIFMTLAKIFNLTSRRSSSHTFAVLKSNSVVFCFSSSTKHVGLSVNTAWSSREPLASFPMPMDSSLVIILTYITLV